VVGGACVIHLAAMGVNHFRFFDLLSKFFLNSEKKGRKKKKKKSHKKKLFETLSLQRGEREKVTAKENPKTTSKRIPACAVHLWELPK
jgi:hypothetical protein